MIYVIFDMAFHMPDSYRNHVVKTTKFENSLGGFDMITSLLVITRIQKQSCNAKYIFFLRSHDLLPAIFCNKLNIKLWL